MITHKKYIAVEENFHWRSLVAFGQNPTNGQNFSINGHWHHWCLLLEGGFRNSKMAKINQLEKPTFVENRL